jgi:hypothetical protein
MPEVRQNPSIPFKDCQGRGAIRQKDYLERLAFPPPQAARFSPGMTNIFLTQIAPHSFSPPS